MRTAGAFLCAGTGIERGQRGSTLPAEVLAPDKVLAILAACRDVEKNGWYACG